MVVGPQPNAEKSNSHLENDKKYEIFVVLCVNRRGKG